MSEFENQTSSLYEEMQRFFQQKARKNLLANLPLIFNTQYKNSLKLKDSEGIIFEVDETLLSGIRDIYIDKACKFFSILDKTVRLNNYEYDIKFKGKRCTQVDLIGDSITFFASKAVKREVDGCHFKISIIKNEAEAANLSPQIKGYLNRLGKKNLCQQSFNIHNEMSSLLSFAVAKPVKVQTFNYKPWKHAQDKIDPFAALTKQGKAVLEKIRHFITKQQIQSFIVDKQVSEDVSSQLERLIKNQK